MSRPEVGVARIVEGRIAHHPSSFEHRYRELFASALVGIYCADVDGTLTTCNQAFARMLGFGSPAEAMGTSTSLLYVDAKERERIVTHLQQRGALEYSRARMRHRDGHPIEIITSVIGEFDEGRRLTALQGFLIDVTANVEATRALRERERQFRAVFVDSADAMLFVDNSRVIVEANAAACALFGMVAEAIVNQPLDGFIVDGADELGIAWRDLLALGEIKREHRVRSASGATRLVECSYRARVHGERHLCIARDITEHRLLEERFTQSQRIESVGRLAGGIAHDFNNLLTAILGYTELLISHREADDPDRSDLEEIQRAGQRAATLTRQLLAFSRKQVLMPKEVDLNQTLSGLRTMLSRLIREDITLSYELASSPAVVRVDPTEIETAILNLVLGARDRLRAAGQIRIEVALVSAAEAHGVFPSRRSGELVRLRVADNGVAVAADVCERLFEQQDLPESPATAPAAAAHDAAWEALALEGRANGFELGIQSVHRVIVRSGGVISVRSEAGEGTAFTMHFPGVSATRVDEASPGAPLDAAGGHETILLVEDEDAVRVIISAILRRQGYLVLEASTPRRASEIFEQNGQEVDLLLTDVVMPEMNGPALARQCLVMRPDLKILFISGYADIAVPVDPRNANIGFLSKPFQASVLSNKVREVLRGSMPSSPGGSTPSTTTM
jgi:two-component system cell cycle sensor histidine kinase/response regulator CckA